MSNGPWITEPTLIDVQEEEMFLRIERMKMVDAQIRALGHPKILAPRPEPPRRGLRECGYCMEVHCRCGRKDYR